MTSINTQSNSCGPGCGHCQSARASTIDRRNPASDPSLVYSPNAAETDSPRTDEKATQNVHASSDTYSPADRKTIEELKARDREVRAHEAAHRSAAGMYARGATSFTYQRGPDGGRYAIGGEVSIDVSPVQGDAHATAQKARQIQAAALAPAQPSGQDMAVAAQAAQMAMQASLASPGAASRESQIDGGKKVDGKNVDAITSGDGSADKTERSESTERNRRRTSAYYSTSSPQPETARGLSLHA